MRNLPSAMLAAIMLLGCVSSAHAQVDIGFTLPTARWSSSDGGLLQELQFNSEGGVARSSTELYDTTTDVGTFSIDGNRVVIDFRKGTQVRLSFAPSADPRYLWELEDSNGTADQLPTVFVSDGLERAPGDTATVDGVDLVVMSGETARCSDNLNVRRTPAASAAKAVIVDGRNKALGSLPAGSVFRVIARTVTQDTIGGKTAPWYLVRLADTQVAIPDAAGKAPVHGSFTSARWGDRDPAGFGWVFGGFLALGDFDIP